MSDRDRDRNHDPESAAEYSREAAMEAYADDPLLSGIEALYDMGAIFEDDPTIGIAYLEGYWRAVFILTFMHLRHSDEYPCDCPDAVPFPVDVSDGWECRDCGAHLVDDSEAILRGND